MSDSEGDFSDELLELAGATEKKRKRSHKLASNPKRRRADAPRELESEDEPESEEEDVNPYPLEGKYIDEADRQSLLQLSEIDRENVLAQRLEELQRKQDKRNLDQMLKAQREDADTVSKAAKRAHTVRGATKEKSRKLDELQAKRKAKDERKRARASSPRGDRSASPMDMEMSSDDEEDGQITKQEEREEWEQKVLNPVQPEDESITLADLEKCRVGREQIGKFCTAPWFAEYIKGAWVRYGIGNDSTGALQYRICEVSDLGQETSKIYRVNDQLINQQFELKHGAAKRSFPMDKVSNGAFTEREFERLVKSCETDKVKLPTKRVLEKKIAQLEKFATHRFTESDINAMLARKQALKSLTGPAPTSIAVNAIERSRLMQARTLAMRRQDWEEVAELDAKMVGFNTAASDEPKKSSDMSDVLAKVNERNRKANFEAIRQAEAIQLERRRQGLANADVGSDPSARLKTKPRMFEENTSRSATPDLRHANGTNKADGSTSNPAPSESKAKHKGDFKSIESRMAQSIEIDLGDF